MDDKRVTREDEVRVSVVMLLRRHQTAPYLKLAEIVRHVEETTGAPIGESAVRQIAIDHDLHYHGRKQPKPPPPKWTASEEDQLLSLVDGKRTLAEIGRALLGSRTVEAVAQRLVRFERNGKLKLKRGPWEASAVWSIEELDATPTAVPVAAAPTVTTSTALVPAPLAPDLLTDRIVAAISDLKETIRNGFENLKTQQTSETDRIIRAVRVDQQKFIKSLCVGAQGLTVSDLQRYVSIPTPTLKQLLDQMTLQGMLQCENGRYRSV